MYQKIKSINNKGRKSITDVARCGYNHNKSVTNDKKSIRHDAKNIINEGKVIRLCKLQKIF